MPATTLPKPLSAYVGLLVATLGEAKGEGRSAAAQMAHLPLAAAGQLLTARHRYDELAEQGDVVVDVLVGGVVGLVKQRFGATGTGTAASDWLPSEFDTVADAAAVFEDLATEDMEDELADDEFAAEILAAEELVAPIEVTQPTLETEPTPREQLDRFSVPTEIGVQAGGLKTAADLPLEDFDHMSGPQLRGRLRKLDRVQLVQLLDYERAHANRVGIVLMLENRLTKLIAIGVDPG